MPPATQDKRYCVCANDVAQCNAIHRSIVEQFKSAIVYGKSVKHQPQRVGLGHELEDEDVGKYQSILAPKCDHWRSVQTALQTDQQ